MTLVAVSALALAPFLPTLTPHSPGFTIHSRGELTVTILVDNFATEDRLPTEWGFAALMETGDQTILYDAGRTGEVLLENMRLLGKDPMAIDAVVISHDHLDHTGGLQALMEVGVRPRFYLLSAFSEELRSYLAGFGEVVETSPGQQILPGIITTGQVGVEIPEQALVLETPEGTVVITGCAHPGVILMAERAQAVSPGPIHAVMGGFHLFQTPPREVQDILAEFRRLQVARAGATHCTGEEPIAAFQEVYGEDFLPLGVGRVFRFSI